MEDRRDAMITKTTTKTTTYVMLIMAGLIGGGGLLAFMLFLYAGSFNLENIGLAEIPALLLNTFLCLLFFIQHSSMARKSYYQRSARFMPAQYGGPVYAIASGIVVLGLVLFWQESAYTIFTLQGIARWFFRAVFFLAIFNVLWALSTGFFVLYRVQPNLDDLRGTEPQPAPLITHGPYHWIRHPLYVSALLLLWSYPDLTLDRLLLNMLFTVWVIAGTLLEERKLVASYGEAYRSYQRKVPMMIPWRIRPG
jgi:protein-S-isoprenylcysteine O-methyltransferase Ste14